MIALAPIIGAGVGIASTFFGAGNAQREQDRLNKKIELETNIINVLRQAQGKEEFIRAQDEYCLLYTSDAADE